MSLAIGTYFILFFPALIFYIIICLKDRGDRESAILLSQLILSGAIVAVPLFFAESKLQSLADKLFEKFVTLDVNGEAIYSNSGMEIVHALVCGFLCVALAEGVVKFLILFFITNKNKEYTSFFDGIFYSTNISVGFCVAKCIIYAVAVNSDTFLTRLIVALPGAFFIGIVTGIFYSLWHTYSAATAAEKIFTAENEIENIKPLRYRFWLILSIVMTVLLRGLDVFTELMDKTSWNIVFYVAVTAFYIFAFVTVFKMKKEENLEEEITERLLSEKYPDYYKKDGKEI